MKSPKLHGHGHGHGPDREDILALLDPDRLFPPDPRCRDLARALHAGVRDLPIVSPHGHTRSALVCRKRRLPRSGPAVRHPRSLRLPHAAFAGRAAWSDLGVPRADGGPIETDGRTIWRLFRRTLPPVPRHAVAALARPCVRDGLRPRPTRLSAATADAAYDRIADCLARPEFRPRALFERFNIEVHRHHRKPRSTIWAGTG